MKSANIEPFVKFPYFHKEQKKAFKNNAFHSQDLYYNAKEDYLVCPMGQHMTKVGAGTRTSENGFVSNITFYEAKNCSSCPLISLCSKTKWNRKIEINHNLNSHKNKVRELLTSEEGALSSQPTPHQAGRSVWAGKKQQGIRSLPTL